ncbi:MAG: oxidoreductase, partial [Chloroflexi bacterium]|nr:oxidoreductase [Chloroflexota bacterium]
ATEGAVFGAPTGWERPLWYASNPSEQKIKYSYGKQSWWPAAKREALYCQSHVSLFELSPFTKIEISGAAAVDFLQKLCCSDIDVAVGQVRYTLMLNQRGGIEAEITLTRIDQDTFWLTSGAATRFKDLFWVKKQLDKEEDISIRDITEARAVLGVMGPRSRELMQSLCDTDFSDGGFAFSSFKPTKIAGCDVIATRLSFVGELGWEISVLIGNA